MVWPARALSLFFGARSEVDALDGEMVLGGGFHFTDQSPGDGELSRGVVDSYREAEWGFGHTFPELEARSMPTPFRLIRIDYIFHSGDTRGRRAYVGDRGGPDRRLLVAELSF